MRVLKQTRRTHRYRSIDNLQKSLEILAYPRRQGGAQEVPEYLLIGHIAKGYGIELVALHKLVKYVGAEHHRAWYGDGYSVKIVAYGVLLYYGVDESQAASFASERPLTDAGKVGIVVETVLTEYRHDTAVLHLAIFDYQVEEQLTHARSVAYVAEAMLLDHLGYGEHSAGIEPARYVVERGMPVQSLGRYVKYGFLKLFQIVDAAYLLAGLGVAHHKVAETELIDYGLAEIHREFLGVLVNERASHRPDIVDVLRFGAFDYEGQIGVTAP